MHACVSTVCTLLTAFLFIEYIYYMLYKNNVLQSANRAGACVHNLVE